jgi:hypothetical protein
VNDFWISITPLLIAALTLASGFFAYSFNKRIDREHSLIELRRTAYKNLLVSIIDVADTNNEKEALKAHHKNLLEVFILGSDEVVGALSDFVQSFVSANSSENATDRKEKFVKLARAMKSDGYEETQLSDEQLKRFVPLRF